MQKVLFLDINGVLDNSYPFDETKETIAEINEDVNKRREMEDLVYTELDKYFGDNDSHFKPILTRIVEIDADKIIHLNKIIKETGAKIILSCSWRQDPHIPLYLAIKGFLYPKSIIGIIPTLIGAKRGEEINTWRRHHPVDRFVVLDDEIVNIEPYISLTNIVKVRGLTEHSADIVISKLNS